MLEPVVRAVRWRHALGSVAVAGCLLTTACTNPSTGPRPASTSAASPTPTLTPTPEQTQRPEKPAHTEKADPRWRFYSQDRSLHTSPWFAGRHRVMIGYGCTTAPYYAHDPRCPGRQGFHHGIDVAMPCGTRLFSAVRGRVLDPASAGAPGAAYGPYAFRIRTGDVDVLVGHVRTVYVAPGDVVDRGQLIARANDQGAPDGCHLHFEVRRAGGGLSNALPPAAYLRLSTS